MATLLFTAVGTAIGGPLGGALGALVGQQADNALFGSGSIEGPRLKELSITTSSYGQPIGRHFGRMRVAGTVIWATDLLETSSTQGGKGQPSTTTYAYSVSFAVALSSTPIDRLGRIWADGDLLRGAAGDLKVEGELRIYPGDGDSLVDPLIAADKGAQSPAFRDYAYVVFEDLQLADFGNRIPSLTFEIFTQNDASVALNQLVPDAISEKSSNQLTNIRGFADEGGALSATLTTIDRVLPLNCATTPSGLSLTTRATASSEVTLLPEQLGSDDREGARERNRSRTGALNPAPLALRYYDEVRDYQPGVQRAIGRRPNGHERLVELPATMKAQGAKTLANENAIRYRWKNEGVTWLIGELDPRVRPGSLVRLPDFSGVWRVVSWEWFERGIELGLERSVEIAASLSGSDTGSHPPPSDRQYSATELVAFELPAQNGNDPARTYIYAAASSPTSNWDGAALFVEQGETLVPIGSTGSVRATAGELSAQLEPSSALLFEPSASMDVRLVADDLIFADTDKVGLASGANRLLVGSEIVQYQHAEPLGEGNWKLHGLLRGRAGTEDAAMQPHAIQTPVVLLDHGLSELSNSAVQSSPSLRLAAIGRGDEEAVFAALSNPGLSRRPLIPVHATSRLRADMTMEFCWTRRARGHWIWGYENEVPLVEETESYRVGYGPVDSPYTVFATSEPTFALTESEREGLVLQHGPADLWVYQVGTYARSEALHLGYLQ